MLHQTAGSADTAWADVVWLHRSLLYMCLVALSCTCSMLCVSQQGYPRVRAHLCSQKRTKLKEELGVGDNWGIDDSEGEGGSGRWLSCRQAQLARRFSTPLAALPGAVFRRTQGSQEV